MNALHERPHTHSFVFRFSYYYEPLNSVRLNGDWEAWLDFFNDAVMATITQTEETTQQRLYLSKNKNSS